MPDLSTTLFDSFEIQGFWWLPTTPERKIAGTLKFASKRPRTKTVPIDPNPTHAQREVKFSFVIRRFAGSVVNASCAGNLFGNKGSNKRPDGSRHVRRNHQQHTNQWSDECG